MQCELIHGVPYLKDSQNRLYFWDPDAPSTIQPTQIGTLDPSTGKVTYTFPVGQFPESLRSHLTQWRNAQIPRSRCATGGNDSGAQAAASEDSEADE